MTFADKQAVRHHVARTVLDLPATFVVKPTHGSGACVVVSHAASADARLPHPDHGWTYAHVLPSTLTAARSARSPRAGCARRTAGGPTTSGRTAGCRGGSSAGSCSRPGRRAAGDVKLFVFHQRCRFAQVDGARFGTRTQDFLNRDGQPLDLAGGHPRSAVAPPPPARLAELVELAERLGAGTDFVRVDLFCLPDRVVVGELTSEPSGGDSPFHPAAWNAEFGRTWQVPRRDR